MATPQQILNGSLQRACDLYEMSGGAIAYRRAGELVVVSYGTDASGAPLEANSIFPVASLTKLATALTVLGCLEEQQVSVDTPIRDIIGDVQAALADSTIRQLLSHTAGYPATAAGELAPCVQWHDRAEFYRDNVVADPVWVGRFRYTDVSYLLLGLVVEALAGSYQTALRRLVLRPLSIRAYLSEPQQGVVRLEGKYADLYNPRRCRRSGSPAAGLKTTAEGALRLVEGIAQPPEWMSPQMHQMMLSNQAGLDQVAPADKEPRPPWGLGPDLADDNKGTHYLPMVARYFGGDCFGAFGSSGSIAWALPALGLTFSILCTRTIGSLTHQTAYWHYDCWSELVQATIKASGAWPGVALPGWLAAIQQAADEGG